MLDYIYHMTLQIFCHLIFGAKSSILCHLLRKVTINVIKLCY